MITLLALGSDTPSSSPLSSEVRDFCDFEGRVVPRRLKRRSLKRVMVNGIAEYRPLDHVDILEGY